MHRGSPGAVTDSDGSCKGDEIARGNIVLHNERFLHGDDRVETGVSMEGSLNVSEGVDGAVGTTTAVAQS